LREKLLQAVVRIACWAMAHCGLAVAVFTLGQWMPLPQNIELYALPIGLGVVQVILLRRSLRWWSLAWVPASLLGLFLSFLGIWWFLLCIGLGMGTTQAMVLAAARVRRSWLWPLASGIGWVVGMLASQSVVALLEPLVGRERFYIVATYGTTTFVYGLFLGVLAGITKRS
jgi:hypothetical protein